MNELSKEFREKHPEGTFEDWVNFYFEEYDGEQRIEDATEKMYPMVEKMKEAFEQVDKKMTQDFVRDLVLFKTYEGFDIQEVILRKLGDKFDAETRRATAEEEREGIDGYIGDQPVQVKPETFKDNLQDDIGVPIVYYDENKSNKAMTVDISELNESMDANRDDQQDWFGGASITTNTSTDSLSVWRLSIESISVTQITCLKSVMMALNSSLLLRRTQ